MIDLGIIHCETREPLTVVDQDRQYIEVALAEARKGLGRTSPNPCVGAVIVNNGRIVGRGYHEKAGTPHAEIHALADAGPDAHGATMYVTLEPCNHTGRTPPCSLAVCEAGIRRVVVGLMDPNPLARGGAGYLQEQGLEVVTGVCEKACRRINYPFIKHVTTGLPWVVMKAALSLDGKISYQPGRGGAISGTKSKEFVHGLRNNLDAILIGVDTAVIDNPSLTTRLPGQESRDPLRIIIDSSLRTDPGSKVFTPQSPAETWIFYSSDLVADSTKIALKRAGAQLHKVSATTDGQVDLKEVLQVLGNNNILSLLVEGGASIFGSLLRHDLIDEVYLLLAPFFIGEQGQSLLSGYSATIPEQVTKLREVTVSRLGNDTLIHGLLS